MLQNYSQEPCSCIPPTHRAASRHCWSSAMKLPILISMTCANFARMRSVSGSLLSSLASLAHILVGRVPTPLIQATAWIVNIPPSRVCILFSIDRGNHHPMFEQGNSVRYLMTAHPSKCRKSTVQIFNPVLNQLINVHLLLPSLGKIVVIQDLVLALEEHVGTICCARLQPAGFNIQW